MPNQLPRLKAGQIWKSNTDSEFIIILEKIASPIPFEVEYTGYRVLYLLSNQATQHQHWFITQLFTLIEDA